MFMNPSLLGFQQEEHACFLSKILNKCGTFVFVSHFIKGEFRKTLTTIYQHIKANCALHFKANLMYMQRNKGKEKITVLT